MNPELPSASLPDRAALTPRQLQLRRLRTCLRRLRRRTGELKLRSPADRVRRSRMEIAQAVLEARAAGLRGQEHLSPVPLLCEPMVNGHPKLVQVDDNRDAVISFLAHDHVRVGEPHEAGIATHRLAFYKVASASVHEEIQHWHRRRFRRMGYVHSRAFYEVRNSRTLKALSSSRQGKLTHWVFYIERMRFEMIAEDVVTLRDNELLRMDTMPC